MAYGLPSASVRWMKKHRKDDAPALVITNDTGKYKVALKSISYIETFNRHLLLHTEQENIICYKSMKELEQELRDKGFVRCHTSYIVNLFYLWQSLRLSILCRKILLSYIQFA